MKDLERGSGPGTRRCFMLPPFPGVNSGSANPHQICEICGYSSLVTLTYGDDVLFRGGFSAAS
jgi:hypothetical protein